VTGSRGALRRVDEERACDFGRGLGRPWGRVARVKLRGKVKSSEWWIFGVEWLLGAANGDRPKTRIQESKSNPMDGGACTLRLRLKLALNPDPSKSKGPAPRFFLSPSVFHPPKSYTLPCGLRGAGQKRQRVSTLSEAISSRCF